MDKLENEYLYTDENDHTTKFKGSTFLQYIRKYGMTPNVKLGSGSFGDVYQIKIKNNTGVFKKYALKKMKYLKSSDNVEQQFAKDANAGRLLVHESVARFYGAVLYRVFKIRVVNPSAYLRL